MLESELWKRKYRKEQLRRKIDEASGDIEKCYPHIIDRLIYAATITAKSFERKIFSENEYEKYLKYQVILKINADV